jgi:hypothetical protein
MDQFLQAIPCIKGSTQEESQNAEEKDGPDSNEIYPAGFKKERKDEEDEQSDDSSN